MPEMMKAAVKTAKGDFDIKEVEMPTIKAPNEVLARVRASGICGSDLHSWKVPRTEMVGKITGHELAGDVVEVGKAVTNVKVGDRVAIESLVGCGVCYWCRLGQYHLCPDLFRLRGASLSQAFSEYVRGPSEKFYRLPDHVPHDEAAILDVYGTSIHAIHRANTKIYETVAIIGAGPVGLSLMELANLAGAKTIILGIYDFPLKIAEAMGAYATINSIKEDAVKKILELTNGLGVDTSFEAVGGKATSITLPQAISLTRRGGKVALIGGAIPILKEFDTFKIRMYEVDLIGVSSYAYWDNLPEFQIVLDLLARRKLNAKRLITHRFPLEKINEAFETAKNKKETNSIKVVLIQ